MVRRLPDSHRRKSADLPQSGEPCRRHPPVRDDLDRVAKFPDVANDFWCGEFIGRDAQGPA
jgi:hypothetical protein